MMNISQLVSVIAEVHRIIPGARVRVSAAAGLVKIEVAPNQDAIDKMIKELEAEGFTDCKVVKESWTKNPVIQCRPEQPKSKKGFVETLKGLTGLAAVDADILEAVATVVASDDVPPCPLCGQPAEGSAWPHCTNEGQDQHGDDACPMTEAQMPRKTWDAIAEKCSGKNAGPYGAR